MALIKDMQETRVEYYCKEKKVIGVDNGLILLQTYLTYIIDRSIHVTFEIPDNPLPTRIHWNHSSNGPMESTGDIRWIINKLYND